MAAAPIVVVGAGPAGLMAAIFASGAGRRVLVAERTRDGGRKILISGGGRCNVLPGELDLARFVTDSSPHTLRNILRSWPLGEQRRFFEEELGVPLKLEPESGKLFPISDRARDVRDALVQAALRRGVELRFETTITGLTPPAPASAPESGLPLPLWTLHTAAGASIEASAVVLATGGLSVPATGSDGIGLRLAEELGHELHPTYAALTPLTLAPPRFGELAGVSLVVTLRAAWGKREITTRGGFLFTHRGYSGPSVLDISHLAVRDVEQEILVQWTDLDREGWEDELAPRRGSLAGALARQLPARLALALQREAGIPDDRSLAELRADERRRLLDALMRFPLPWSGHEGYRKAEVTGGGVALSEVDPRTLESRRHRGLFLCGEMLDAFGPIGGYNFVWAWVTGRAAGLGAAA